MKKLLFFAVCLLFAGAVSAQGYYYGPRYYGPRRVVRRPPPRRQEDNFYRVRIGIAGGLNVANTVSAYDAYYSTGTIAAFHAGLTLDIPLVYPLSFAPEALFSQKGYSATAYANDGSTVGTLTQRSNFIDVPLLLKFRLGPFVNFSLGPQLSFPVSTTTTFNNGFDPSVRDSYNTTSDKTLVGGVVGVGFNLSPDVELRFRYAYDFNESDDNAASGFYNYRNQVFQVGLGFKF